MGDYRATVSTVGDATGEDDGGLVVEHHLTPRAAIDIESWSGAHLLHLAVAGCLFNDILREAPKRGIAIDHLAVTADGGFDTSGSTGIHYAIEVRSSADQADVERLVADMEADAAIPKVVRAGVAVEAVEVRILSD
jgi:organic hydroperoxide reductase OsmC/OhrA